MKIESSEQDGVQVVTIDAAHLDAGDVDVFRREVAGILDGTTKVVFDLSPVEFVDSSGLGALLSCMRKLNGKGGELRLCGVAPAVRTLFELVRMHRILDIHNTREEAIRSFQ